MDTKTTITTNAVCIMTFKGYVMKTECYKHDVNVDNTTSITISQRITPNRLTNQKHDFPTTLLPPPDHNLIDPLTPGSTYDRGTHIHPE